MKHENLASWINRYNKNRICTSELKVADITAGKKNH